MCGVQSLGTLKQGCDIKTSEILSRLPLENNSVTMDGTDFF